MELVIAVPIVGIFIFIGMFLGGGKGERNWLAGCVLIFVVVLSLFLTLLTAL